MAGIFKFGRKTSWKDTYGRLCCITLHSM